MHRTRCRISASCSSQSQDRIVHYSSFNQYLIAFYPRLLFLTPVHARPHRYSSSFRRSYPFHSFRFENLATICHICSVLSSKINPILIESFELLNPCFESFSPRLFLLSLIFEKMRYILEHLRLFQANSFRFIIRTSNTSYLTRSRPRNSHYLSVARAHSSGVK